MKNKIILMLLSLALISCSEEDGQSNLPAKTLSDNWSSQAISAELKIVSGSEILGLQLIGDISGTLGLGSGDHLLSQILSVNTTCLCGTDFIGDNLSGSFVFSYCQAKGGRGDVAACNALSTTGSYEIKSNQLLLTPSSGQVMIFK